MRRWLLLMMLALTLYGCKPKDPLTQIVENMDQQTYLKESAYLTCRMQLDELADGAIRYRVIVDQPKTNLDNVHVVVKCLEPVGDTIPSFGFYENDKCHLYIDKIDKENHYYEGLSLLGLTDQDAVVCYVYLSFEIEGQVVTEYIQLEGNVNDEIR